ncbi:MAG: metal transporter [Burkholderiales bacterium]|nr:metal transporter [Burkholderiales bacterium]
MTLPDRPPAPPTRPVLRALVAITALALAGGAGYLLRGPAPATETPAADAASAASATPAVTRVNGVTTVTLDAATQAGNGIRAEPLEAAQYRDEAVASAVVVDLQPLIDLRTRYAAAATERATAAALQEAARQEYERNRALYAQDQNVSLKALQAAQAGERAARARAEAASRALVDVRGALRTQYGQTLAQWAADPQSAPFQRLLDHREVLVQVTAPLGTAGADAPRIEVAGTDNRRQVASFVARAQQVDAALAGTGAIYRTAASPATANGARLQAFVPRGDAAPAAGVVVPANALVWFAGQPWAFVQATPERFARTPVPTTAPMGDGYFVSQGIAPGARVVVSGAQLLLSEELKPRTAGSACKDPECD